MNFLAHAYLSFGNNDLLVGNLIADTVRGKQIEKFPEGISQGIRLHRMIDSFTDSHPVVIQTTAVFKDSVGRYSGSFLDVAYDHFLSLDMDSIPKEGWAEFAVKCYSVLESRGDILPAKFGSMYLYMRRENWLANYGEMWMIEKSFERLTRRASYLAEDVPVFDDFIQKYDVLKDSYNKFFPDLKAYTEELINKL